MSPQYQHYFLFLHDMANSLLKRTISGAVYVGLIVGCILGGGDWVQTLSSIFAILAGIELTKITVGLNQRRNPALMLDLISLLILAYGPSLVLLPFWIIVVMARGIAELYLKDPKPLLSLGLSFAMQIYIGLPCWLMSFFADDTGAPMLLLAIFAMIWINDTGAFLVGCSIGRHRLFERLSPKKSWEGFFGGWVLNLIAATVFALSCAKFFGIGSDILVWLGLATVVTFFSTWGDLLESLIKRSLDIKDSGNIIPGHGGILDRIDSFLMVMPAAAVYYYFVVA